MQTDDTTKGLPSLQDLVPEGVEVCAVVGIDSYDELIAVTSHEGLPAESRALRAWLSKHWNEWYPGSPRVALNKRGPDSWGQEAARSFPGAHIFRKECGCCGSFDNMRRLYPDLPLRSGIETSWTTSLSDEEIIAAVQQIWRQCDWAYQVQSRLHQELGYPDLVQVGALPRKPNYTDREELTKLSRMRTPAVALYGPRGNQITVHFSHT